MSAQSSAGAGLAGILSRLQAPKKSQMEALVPFAILAAVLLLVVRIPSGLLDIFVIISLISGVVILLNTMYVNTPLDFSIFPAVILFTTIFRLFLNVATTRSILSNAEAGHVINTFATYVTGGNEVVGLVIFLIIVIINFVVVTHGAQRIGEVAARFTLDALPGKQISIDADLNAGVINEEQARARRRKLERETEYFGAMDGASKFVQRDAMAGIILIIVNIGAGFIIGMLQMKMGAAESLSTFTSLTVGDGLVANIPALLISTATGIMVTKAASDETVGLSMITQLTSQSRPLMISAGFILVLMMVPGMPKLLMALAAGTLFAIAQVAKRTEMEEGQQGSGPDGSGAAGGAGGEGGQAPAEELSEEEQARHNLEQLLSVDLLELEIGYGLIPLVDSEQGGDLLERVNNIRKQIAIALGFIVPPMRIRDNITLRPGDYNVKIRGNTVGHGELMLDRYLAMNPTGEAPELSGVKVREPAFGLDAYWINPDERAIAESDGYTVVDSATVLATHLTELIRRNCSELLGRQAVQELLDLTKQKFPAVVQDLVPDRLGVGEVQRVLMLLLAEGVSIRNLPLILECLGDHCSISKDPEVLTEYVRVALGRQIAAEHADAEGRITVLTLDPRIEEKVANSLQNTTTGTIPVLPPAYLRRLIDLVTEQVGRMQGQGYVPAFIVSPRIRPYLRKVFVKLFPGLVMLSYGEIAGDVEIRTFATVANPEEQA
ncbi:MAG: flagellar biosynthesis protein FlhA [bacterium]